MKDRLTRLLFLALIFTALPLFTSGQTGIEASPYRIEETVEPGDTIVRTIRVRNTTDRERTFYADVMNFVALGEDGNLRLVRADEDNQRERSLTDWVDIRKSGLDFEPGERREMQVTFNIPEDVTPGGYYGAVVVGPSPPDVNGEGTFVGLNHQVGVLTLFNVMGEIDVEGRVREFSTGSQVYDAPLDVDFLSRVENTGSLHIKPYGSIQIENMRGEKIASVPVNRDGDNALPDSVRRFRSNWEDDFGFGRYRARLILNFGEPAYAGGTGVRTMTSETDFWVLPKRFLLQVGIGLLIAILLLYLAFRVYREKTIKELMRETGKSRSQLKKKKTGGFGLVVFVFLLSVLGITFYVYFFLF